MSEQLSKETSAGRWNRDQLKLAYYLYCQLPFGKFHHRNPEVMKLATLIGRTPSAVAMKLSNFASLDPLKRFSPELIFIQHHREIVFKGDA